MTPIQQTPQLFSLVLVLCVVCSFMVVLAVVYRFGRGRRSAARQLLLRWTVCAVVYLAISVGVSLTRPVKVIEQGQDWCFDEWCVAVEAVHRTSALEGRVVTVTTDLRISNKGRSPEAVRGFWALLLDDQGRRYEPTPGPWRDVVASRVPGHGSARTAMAFVVPTGIRLRGFVTNHGGGSGPAFLSSLLEIGQGGWLFHRQNMIRVE
jgi:hypothetical protein